MGRLEHIKTLLAQPYGAAALAPGDVEWLVAQLSEARARLATEQTNADYVALCDDLATLVRRLIKAARNVNCGDMVVEQAAEFLERNGLYGSPLRVAAPAAPTAQQPHRLKETSVVQSNNSAGPLSTQADTRAAAVERAAELAGRVAGEETANTIRNSGVVLHDRCQCIHCMRLD